MSNDDIRKELEAKDAEIHRQQELANEGNEQLRGYDKTDADSFPASDPPSTMPGEHGAVGSEDDRDAAGRTSITSVRPSGN